MINYIGRGQSITMTAPRDVVAGDVIQGDQKLGVVHSDALAGELVAVWVKGEFLMPANNITIDALQPVDWNGTFIVPAVGQANAGQTTDFYTNANEVRVLIG